MNFRYELGESVYGVDAKLAKQAIASVDGASHPREADPDMGTWWGRNQPRVMAFTIIAEDDFDARRIADAVKQTYSTLIPIRDFGSRPFATSRRKR